MTTNINRALNFRSRTKQFIMAIHKTSTFSSFDEVTLSNRLCAGHQAYAHDLPRDTMPDSDV